MRIGSKHPINMVVSHMYNIIINLRMCLNLQSSKDTSSKLHEAAAECICNSFVTAEVIVLELAFHHFYLYFTAATHYFCLCFGAGFLPVVSFQTTYFYLHLSWVGC